MSNLSVMLRELASRAFDSVLNVKFEAAFEFQEPG
jgi:hypothetical protein